VEYVVFILDPKEIVGAMWKVLLVLLMVSSTDGLFRSMYRNTRVSVPRTGDAGQPLFLSPYIESGKIKEGEFKSEKPLDYFHGFLKHLFRRMQNTFQYFYSIVLFQILVI
jgi:hypothetical protein